MSAIAMLVIIIFVVTLIAAIGYVIWFAITKGLWDTILSNVSALERDIISMVTQAEKNASTLGGLITREYKQAESEVVKAYGTVATSLVNTGLKIKAGGEDTINKINSGGRNAVTTIETAVKNLGNRVTSETEEAVRTIKSTTLDTIGKIQDTAASSIFQLETAYNTIKSTLTDTSRIVSKQSMAIIDKIKTDVTTGYTTIDTGAKNAYTIIEGASKSALDRVSTGTLNVISQIENGGDTAINTITRTTTSVVNQINAGTLQLANQIAREVSGAADTVASGAVSTYQTVSSAVTTAGNRVKTAGEAAINEITLGYDTSIRAAVATINTAKTEVTGVVQTSIITLETTATSTISNIKNQSTATIAHITTAFTELQNSFTQSSAKVSAQSQATIRLIQEAVTSSYAMISQEATNAVAAANSAVAEGVATIKAAGNQAVRTGADVGGRIETNAASAMNKITLESTTVLNQITAGSNSLTQQITAAATAAGALNPRIPPGAQSTTIESFQSSEQPTVPIEESLFFNVQYLSIKDTGFLGPYPSGTYKEDIATANALKAGCRFLTLQIDYTDTKMDLSLYEVPGVPTLLVRGPTGKLLSKNSGSIEDVANTIATMAFNPLAPNNTMPIILYLHVVRAPSAVDQAEEYMSFLSQIAEALNPLAPFHLGLHPLGNFTRQKMAKDILTLPINSLTGNIIIMSNADTSLFRRSTLSKAKYPPAKDLDFWVNIRVYLDDAADANGITELADPATQPSAVLVNMSRVLSLSGVNKDAFAAKGKRRYVIAMADRVTNPTPAQLNAALNTLGINSVPIDIFTENTTNIVLLSNEYENKSYRAKPLALQFSS